MKSVLDSRVMRRPELVLVGVLGLAVEFLRRGLPLGIIGLGVVAGAIMSLHAVGIIPSEGDTGYAEIVFASDADGSSSPLSVGVSRWESAEQLRARLVSELRDAG